MLKQRRGVPEQLGVQICTTHALAPAGAEEGTLVGAARHYVVGAKDLPRGRASQQQQGQLILIICEYRLSAGYRGLLRLP